MPPGDRPDDVPISPLLALPAELRNAIWTELLVIKRDAPQTHGPDTCKAITVCPSILRTCRQTHHEATPILYAQNTFRAHPALLTTLPSLVMCLATKRTLRPVLHPRVAAMIRKWYVHLRLDTDPRFTKRQAAECFSGADELAIDVFQAMYGSCNFDVLGLFEDVRGVGRVRVHGSVGDGEYARWIADMMMSPAGTEAGTYTEQYIGGKRA